VLHTAAVDAPDERRFWLRVLLALAGARLLLAWWHPWPWLEGEEFDHLRPIVNLREGLGLVPLAELWKQPMGLQAGGMPLLQTALASLAGVVLPGWWALRAVATGWWLLAAATTVALGRQLGASRQALVLVLICVLPVDLESRMAAYGDYFEAATIALALLAVCARSGGWELRKRSVFGLAAAVTATTWLSMVLAPAALLSLALLVRRDRRLALLAGVAVGALPALFLGGPGGDIALLDLLLAGLDSWHGSEAWPQPGWFATWIDPTSPLLPDVRGSAAAGRVVLGVSMAGLLMVRALCPGWRLPLLGAGLLCIALTLVVALELLGFGPHDGPVEAVSWNHRRLALLFAVAPIGGAVALTAGSRLAPEGRARTALTILLALPWLLASAPGGALIWSGPDRAGFSDPTPLVLCHEGNGRAVRLCVGDINRPSLVALARPWPVEEPADRALHTALRAVWSIIHLGEDCSFHSPPSPEQYTEDDADVVWRFVGRGLAARCPDDLALGHCELAPPGQRQACVDGVRVGRARLDALGLAPAEHR
jgi:hypothetical protein